jgi:hypothetical protein
VKKFLFLFFALCSLTHLTASTLIWETPVQISTLGVTASSPAIAEDPNGNATAIWVEGGNIVTNSLPFGGSWGTNTTLDSSGTASSPKIGIASNGDAVAIWISSGVIQYATLSSGIWTVGASGVSSLSETASKPSLAVDSSGNAILTWQNSSGQIEVATKLAGGSWSLVSVLASSGSDSPHVAINNGRAIIVWHTLGGSTHTIQYSNATVGGSWSTAASIFFTTTAFPNGYPKVTLDPFGNATAVCFRYQTTSTGYVNVVIVSSTLLSGSSNWSVPEVISDIGYTNPANLSLHIRSDSIGNVTAFWMQSFDGATFSSVGNQKPFGGNWTTAAPITLNGISGPAADLQINSLGDVVAVFMNYDGTDVNIQSTDSYYGGFLPNIWSAPTYVSTGTDNGFPRVSTSYTTGVIHANAVWLQFDGTNTILNAATGSRTMVLPPTNLSIVQNSTDYGVFTDYYNTVSWTATTDPNAVEYVVFRNGIFLRVLSLSETSFVDDNQLQNGPVTYGVAAANSDSQLSPIQTVSLP